MGNEKAKENLSRLGKSYEMIIHGNAGVFCVRPGE
jgi:hypothetical protein